MMSLKIRARVVGYVLIVIFGLVCANLLIMGTRTFEATEERVQGEHVFVSSEARRQPQIGAVVPLVMLMIIAMGLTRDQAMPAAWLGWAMMIGLSAPLVFNVGLLMLPMAGILALPLSVLQWQISGKRGWLVAGWIGTALLLGEGWLFRMSPGASGAIMLAIGLVMVGVMAWMQFQEIQPQRGV